MSTRKIFALIGALLIAAVTFAQQAKTDFTLVDKAYRSASSLSMQVAYNLYATHESAVLHSKQKGFYKKKGKLQLAEVAGVETLWKENMTVVCDKNNRLIVLANPVKTINQAFQLDIDTLLKLCSKVSYDETAAQKKYRLEFAKTPYSEYTAIEVSINKSSWMVDKLVLFYRQARALDVSKPQHKTQPRLEIVYSEVKKDIELSSEEFSENRYIETKRGKTVCADAYSAYRFVNQKNR